MTINTSSAQSLFANLWEDYIAFNPQAKCIYDLILKREQSVAPSIHELVNDHIALRTFDVPKMNVTALAKNFENRGYTAKGEYEFTEKFLYARHFEHADERMPKVFISELKTGRLSPAAQTIIRDAVENVTQAMIESENILWSRRPWKATHANYLRLLDESEYAAWLYAFGFRANHFTISFNHLKSFGELKDLNAFLGANGYALNTSGGEIKGSKELFLEQSSTLAEKTDLQFDDGVFNIPACYYEFARRYTLPNGQLYQGFVAASADKIFESTNVRL